MFQVVSVVMKKYRLLAYTLVISLGPTISHAEEPVDENYWRDIAAQFMDVSRPQAINAASTFSDCSGYFQGVANTQMSEDDKSLALIAIDYTRTLENAAVIVWSKHGSDFTKINEIKEDSSREWSVLTSIAYSTSGTEDQRDRVFSKLEECRPLLNISTAIKKYYGNSNAEWK